MTPISLTAFLGTHEQESERSAPLFYPKELDESELFDLGVKKGVNFEAYNKIPMKVTGEGPVPKAVPAFKDMSLRKVLLDNLTMAEFLRPTPIQKYAIPILMNRRDLMACAQTGSGKTVRTQNYIQGIILFNYFVIMFVVQH